MKALKDKLKKQLVPSADHSPVDIKREVLALALILTPQN